MIWNLVIQFNQQEVVAEVTQTVLSRQEYCIVTDPIDSKGRNQLGKKELRRGVMSFFLHPGKWRQSEILHIWAHQAGAYFWFL